MYMGHLPLWNLALLCSLVTSLCPSVQMRMTGWEAGKREGLKLSPGQALCLGF